jgi:hypothetical protein
MWNFFSVHTLSTKCRYLSACRSRYPPAYAQLVHRFLGITLGLRPVNAECNRKYFNDHIPLIAQSLPHRLPGRPGRQSARLPVPLVFPPGSPPMPLSCFVPPRQASEPFCWPRNGRRHDPCVPERSLCHHRPPPERPGRLPGEGSPVAGAFGLPFPRLRCGDRPDLQRRILPARFDRPAG